MAVCTFRACYANEIKKIIALDSLSTNICIYSPDCIVEKKIFPRTYQNAKDAIILDFAWSHRQRRVIIYSRISLI